MAEVDRSKRYSGTAKAKAKAEATASGKSAPHPKDQPSKTTDPGPDKGKDATWGVVADRHKREHGDMTKRHADELAATVERHAKEAKDMHGRHGGEMQDHLEQSAKGKAEATAGSPPTDTVKSKDEGKKGSEV